MPKKKSYQNWSKEELIAEIEKTEETQEIRDCLGRERRKSCCAM